MDAPLSLAIACLVAAACSPAVPARQSPPADGRAEIDAFSGIGKLLYLLHRGTDGAWRIQREMWNMALSPEKGGGK